jgi:hypothetical protein
MQAMTTYDKSALIVFNRVPLWVLFGACKAGNIRLDINNGIITGAQEKARDYVSVYDGRNMYIN